MTICKIGPRKGARSTRAAKTSAILAFAARPRFQQQRRRRQKNIRARENLQGRLAVEDLLSEPLEKFWASRGGSPPQQYRIPQGGGVVSAIVRVLGRIGNSDNLVVPPRPLQGPPIPPVQAHTCASGPSRLESRFRLNLPTKPALAPRRHYQDGGTKIPQGGQVGVGAGADVGQGQRKSQSR